MNFKPTYLYIKTHNVTGLKYFGKTTRKDPVSYTGSGRYWKYHIEKHGYDVTTEIIGFFTVEEECVLEALRFSDINNIVESKEWANLCSEKGIDGNNIGLIWEKRSLEEKNIIFNKIKQTKNNKTKEEKEKIIIKMIESRNSKTEEEKREIQRKRVESWKKSRAKKTKEELDLEKIKRKEFINNRTQEEKEVIRKKQKDSWKNRTQEEKEKDSKRKSEYQTGRKYAPEVKEMMSKINRNRFVITNGVEIKKIRKDQQIPDRWVKGVNSEWRHNSGKGGRGNMRITNGEVEKIVELDFVIPEGWKRGRKDSFLK